MDDGRVHVISETIQEFEGERFYKCGNYYQHKGRRLHRAVWECYNGPIPDGYVIHHKDHNTANNDISNLALLTEAEHMEEHYEQHSENGKKAIQVAIIMAPEWHRSDAGKDWHSEHAQNTWADRKPQKRTCVCCGNEYESIGMRSRFCCNNCKSKYYRKHKSK